MNVDVLPLYKCHKVVRAAKIQWIDARPETVEEQGSPLLSLEYGTSGQMCGISAEFIQKHKPESGGYLVVYEDGYLSYSPAEVFEAGYHAHWLPECSEVGKRPVAAPEKVAGTIDPQFAPGGLDFSSALNWLKAGKRVQRAGWNGKGMFLLLVASDAWNFECDVDGVDGLEASAFICMKTADDKLVPWFASQTDLLAADWQVYVEPLETDMPPHQLRVLQEMADLADKHQKLLDFTGTELFASLPEAERDRLARQHLAMGDYLNILSERVAAF